MCGALLLWLNSSGLSVCFCKMGESCSLTAVSTEKTLGMQQAGRGSLGASARGPSAEYGGSAAILSPAGLGAASPTPTLNERPEFPEPGEQCRRALVALLAAGVRVLAGSLDLCAKGPGINMQVAARGRWPPG